MQFVSDPPITTKVRKMKQRIRWRETSLVRREIDQTRLVLDDGANDNPNFSFLVLGDSGAGPHYGHNPQRKIAELLLQQREQCRFLLHTGDVIYLVGSSEYYLENFISPYREFLVGGKNPEHIVYDKMVFNQPFLPVPGNHDYYDLPPLYSLISGVTLPLRRLFRSHINFDVGWHGSGQGQAYAQAFLDYLVRFRNERELASHLDTHYTAKTETGRCLRYQSGQFTRLPNRYFSFRSGGIEFFAIDSNTFNAPLPLPATRAGDAHRRQLESWHDDLERQKSQILEGIATLNPERPDDAEQIDDLHGRLEQIDEIKMDIDKQLRSRGEPSVDLEQLDWLQKRLIESWHTADVRGRVLYFHHPPYVTEASKWYQAQTLTIRRHLRRVLDAVSGALDSLPAGRPLVDLILSGHAHCFEHIRTLDTGHADSNLNWIICGGSGYSLRRQRSEGPELTETYRDHRSKRQTRLVARSQRFIGRHGHGSRKRRPYSMLQIDVRDGVPPAFTVRPFIVERFQHQWHYPNVEPFVI